MNWQKITELPCVINVLRQAEKEIGVLTGKEVLLVIAEVNLTKEDKKQILQDTVCSYFDVSWKDVISKTQTKEIVNARHTYMYFSARLGSTREEVAADCGGRHHTSVTNAIQKIEGFYQVHDEFIIHVEAIKSLLPKDILK